MEERKLIYQNGHSTCFVEYDGEIIRIVQELDGDTIGDVLLYSDELDEVVKFVKSKQA